MNWLIGSTLLVGAVAAGPLPPPPEEVLALPPELSERLHEEIIGAEKRQEDRLDRLVEFMFSTSGLDFDYIVEPTTSVSETFQAGKGNCLSFTLLFIAMAEEAGMRSYPHEVDVPLGWRRNERLVFQSSHINVGVSTPTKRYIVDFEPDRILARRLASRWRGQRVDRERALAHFYNNRAVELLAEGQLDPARAWSEQSLKMSPDFTAALNNRGVIERRLGNTGLAESFFLQALEIDEGDSGALFNLIALYRQLDHPEEVAAYQERVESLRPKDPYFQWELGKHHEDLGNLGRAHRFYSKAADMMPQEHQFHGALARVLRKMGHGEEAVEAFSEAVRYSHAEDRETYRNEIESIRQAAGEGGL
ncbi:MAG: tetratricopeptide repeat protein [Wenzhouxiangella sp.]